MTMFSDPALFRLLLVVSVAVAFAVYTRFHLVGGGSVSGGYVAILALTGSWQTLVGVALIAGLTLIVTRGVILRTLSFPRSWVFVLSVLSGALLTAALLAVTPAVEALSGFIGIAIAFGAFVIPGLLTYDISHQGLPRTMLALTMVTVGTIAVCLPAFLLMAGLPSGTENVAPIIERVPENALAYAIILSIVIGGVLRCTAGLRTGGFIGALFIVEFFTLTAFVTVIAAALATHAVMRIYDRFVLMSPRQRSMFALILGSLVAWFSLYWASALGWVPAMEANAYTLSPLLAVGLVAADMGRPDSSALRTIIGTSIACLVISVGVWITTVAGILLGVAYAVAVAALVTPAFMGVLASWRAAESAGRERTGTMPT